MAANGAIVIKKIKKGGGHGHHGGAWKVAYADFVTAMMAFFLLMWLINTTTPEQKRGIADYFAPSAVSKSESGAGGVLAGAAPADDGAKSAGTAAFVVKLKEPEVADKKRAEEATKGSGLKGNQNAEEERMMDAAAARLRQAMQSTPELTELSKHVLIDDTDEGMRIQLVDQDERSMFAAGDSTPTPRVRRLLTEVAQAIAPLSNRVSISGHTDGQPFNGPGGYSNWDLSAARANAARRILEENGLPQNRIAQVNGKAGAEPLYPDNPFASANRRISIVLMREAPVLPPDPSP